MPQRENVLWDVLGLMNGHQVTETTRILDKPPTVNMYDNAYSVTEMKGILVLSHSPRDIEDTLCFMEHRSYFKIHIDRLLPYLPIFCLSDKAMEVVQSKSLPEEEEKAFQESLWNVDPKLYGVGPNWREAMRRLKKLQNKE